MDAARGTVPRITTIDSSTPAPLSWVESVMARLVQDGSFHLITYSKSTVDTTADENMAIEQDVDHLDFPRLLITDALHHSNEPDVST